MTSIKTLALLLGTSLILPSFVFAQTTNTIPSISGHPIRQAMREDHCTLVTNHINNLDTRLSNDENVRDNRHQKVIDRVNTIISKLQAAGMSTDKLSADVTTLIQKKTTWDSAYQTLLTDLNNTKSFGCGTSDGQYVQAVKDARAQRLTLHDANVDFWTFVTGTVIPDIQAARKSLQVTKTTPSPTK